MLRVAYGRNTFLLTGDATTPEMKRIEAHNPGCLSAQVFKNPHHNGAHTFVAELCRPIITVFSTSASCRPAGSYLSLLKKLGSVIYNTASNRNSHVRILSDGMNLSVFTAR